MKIKKMVASCPAGLGNRIKCMVSTIKRCSESTNYEVIAKPCVYWPINNQCGCDFEDIFKSDILFEDICEEEFNLLKEYGKTGDAHINKSWKLETDYIKDIDFKYNRLPRSSINEFLPYIHYIKPRQDIVDMAYTFVNIYKDSFSKNEVIGVHIRKGDFIGLYDGRHRISKEEYFIEKMRCLLEINPNYKFLLCTEDEDTEERFRKIFGSSRVIFFQKRFRDRNTKESIKEAFVDMLLLSRCSIIIGTFLSTFTEMAWWFGGCNAQVIIPGSNDSESVKEVMSKLPKDGESVNKKILRKIKILIKERK